MSVAEDIIITVVAVILMITGDILCVYFCKNICKNSTNDKNNQQRIVKSKKISVISVIVFTNFLITINIQTIGSIMYISSGSKVTNTIDSIYSSAGIFYTIGILGIVLIFILRIAYTFQGSLSIFSYSSQTIKILYASFIINIIWLPLIFVSLFINNFLIVSLFAGIFNIHYFTNYVICFVLFIKKIIVMIKYKLENHSDDKNNQELIETANHETSSNQVEINNNSSPPNDDEMINDVVFEIDSIDLLIRYSLLVLIGFTTTIITIISGIISIITYDQEQGSNDFENMLFSIDSFVNALCIYLLFGFGKCLYYKLCKQCDKYAKNCFIDRLVFKRIDPDGQLTVEQSKALLFETL